MVRSMKLGITSYVIEELFRFIAYALAVGVRTIFFTLGVGIAGVMEASRWHCKDSQEFMERSINCGAVVFIICINFVIFCKFFGIL